MNDLLNEFRSYRLCMLIFQDVYWIDLNVIVKTEFAVRTCKSICCVELYNQLLHMWLIINTYVAIDLYIYKYLACIIYDIDVLIIL